LLVLHEGLTVVLSAHAVRKSVTVKVPATTANIGSGYDSIGMAVDLWNELTVEHASEYVIRLLELTWSSVAVLGCSCPGLLPAACTAIVA